MSTPITAIHLAQRPLAAPDASTWELREDTLPAPGDGQFLVEVRYISVDPAMRGWLDDTPSYIPPVQVGAVMRAAAVGIVRASNHPDFPVGAWVHGLFGVRSHAISDGRGCYLVDAETVAPEQYLGTLGLTGLTAYFGLLELGKPQADETVLVSGAAGAVGSIVVQLARRAGARVVGIAGSQDKCNWLAEELGCSAVINYKEAQSLTRAIGQAAPDGVDLYFDNVGGRTLDAALANTARNARIVCCGAIADYNSGRERTGIRNYPRIITHSLTVRGFTIGDFGPQLAEGRAALAGMLADGSLKSRVHRFDGDIADFPAAFDALFAGQNTGKLVLALPEKAA